MNAAIRAVVRCGIEAGLEVWGIERGYEGLLDGELRQMDRSSVGDILHRGGTILKTARSERFMEACWIDKAAEMLATFGIGGLVVIGGDGSLRGGLELAQRGIRVMGLPGTIDNDLHYTDFTIGFDTAVSTVLEAISKIRDTSSSHDRTTVIEVMGRRCGDIALYSGIASGAEIIIVPEIAYDMEDVVLRINRSRANGKHSNIIVLAEGVSTADEFSKKLQAMTTYTVRGTTIGHVQRGGSPSMADRMLAAQFGNHAVRLLKDGIGNRVVGIHKNEIIDLDIIEAVSMKKKFNYELYETLQMISM